MQQEVLQKGVYIISGPNKIRVVSGEVEAIGKKFQKEEGVFIPEGKRIPIEVQTVSVVEIEKQNLVEKVQTRTIPEDWDKVVDYLISKKINSVIIFGEVDTGKTFFSTYIVNKLLAKNLIPSVLDCDTGQSDIGPPSTLGVAVFKKPILFMTEVEPNKLYFVGSHSPSEHFLYYLCGFTKLVKYGIENSDIVIIDTPGWVLGDGGRMLRNSEVEILRSLVTNFVVILLQRKNEVEHLVVTLPKDKVIKLAVSKKASYTSAEERKKLREFVYKKYFSQLEKIELDFDKIKTDRVYFLTGQQVQIQKEIRSSNILWIEKLPGFEGLYVVSEKLLSQKEHEVFKEIYDVKKIRNVTKKDFDNVIVSLLDEEHEVICLGIIEEIDFVNKKMYIYVPKGNENKDIKIVQFGSLKLTSDIKEAGFVEPGIL